MQQAIQWLLVAFSAVWFLGGVILAGLAALMRLTGGGTKGEQLWCAIVGVSALAFGTVCLRSI